jgi:biotin carboxylase
LKGHVRRQKMKSALILGGTVPHMELIRQLKERGYYTILIDYLDNPPAKDVADEHIKESTLDSEKVLKIAEMKKADLVISGCVDQANITACYVMEKMNKHVPYSYDIAKKITNKGYMKKVMSENDIPTSKYIYINNKNDIPKDIHISYPVMVKPADSNSANGVKKAYNENEMYQYLNEALQISRNEKGIVEEYIEGKEISAYCFVKNKKAKLLMTAERLSVIEGDEKVIKCYASIAPAKISKKAHQRAEDIATKIAKAFNLDNTPLFFQGIVKGDEIYVIEFAPRVGGGISYKTIRNNTGFDIISATIDSYLGQEAEYHYHEPKHIYSVNTIYGKDSIYDHMEGAQKLIDGGTIEDIFYHKKSGATLDNSRASSSRIGAFIVKADDEAEMFEKVHRAYEALDAKDENGRSIIRRELNIDNLLNHINR